MLTYPRNFPTENPKKRVEGYICLFSRRHWYLHASENAKPTKREKNWIPFRVSGLPASITKKKKR